MEQLTEDAAVLRKVATALLLHQQVCHKEEQCLSKRYGSGP